jgi:O-antigen/teichoic acid export membrane protein
VTAAVESVLNAAPGQKPGLERIAPQAGRLFASQVVRRSFRMAILFLAARMVGVETFGVYALLLTVVEMIAIVSGTGYMDFLTREVAQRPDSAWPLGKRVTHLRLAYVVPGLSLVLALLAVLRFSSSVIVNVALLALTLFPRAVGETAQGILKGLQHFSPLPWIELAQGSVVLVCVPVFVRSGMGIRGVIAAEVLGAFAGAVLAVRSLAGRLNFAGVENRTLRSLARSILTFNVYPLIANIYDRVDVVLLARLAGSFAVGIYSLPYRVFAMLLIIPHGLMGALLPVFSSDASRRDIRETCSIVMQFLLVTALLIVLATWAFAGPILVFLLGRSYWESILAVKILVWAAVPAFLNFTLNVLLLSANRERVFLWTGSVCTVFNVLANLLLIPRFSYVAAAGVTVATECLLLGQNMYLARRAMGRLVLPKDGLKITTTFILVFIGYWLLQRAVPQVWAGTAACVAFAVIAVAMLAGLRYFPMSGARGGIE